MRSWKRFGVFTLSAMALIAVVGCGSSNSTLPATYTIGGTVTGLTSAGLVLQDNGGNNLPVSAGTTSFTFSTAIASGGTYSVTVLTQPSNPTQTCGASAGGSGAVASANVTSVVVSCIDGIAFALTGNMTTARDGHTATLLNNGQVLIAGGYEDALGDIAASAELYNPATGTFTATGSMTDFRASQTATLLNNGQVLIAGGYEDNLGDNAATAEPYDPATGTFTFGGSMTTARIGHTATLLNNGQVLIAGGVDDTGTVLASAELYLPTTLTPTGLVSITVTPTTPTVSVGSTQQFVATGRFSDNSTQILQSVEWSSSNAAAATVSNDATDHGVALAVAAGKSTITASAGSISGSTVLTVQ